MTDYGTDIDCKLTDGGIDIDESFRVVSGQDNVWSAIIRRLTTRRGALRRHPDYGYDLRQLLRKGLTASHLTAAQREASIELQKDERISRARVTLTLLNNKLKASIAVLLLSGETLQRVFILDETTISLVTNANN